MDGDGKPDMVVGDATGKIHFFKNTSSSSTVQYPSMTQQNWFGIDVGENAAPFIYDMNNDGLKDLVIGSRVNNIKYYWNYGTATNPLFSPDSVNAFLGGIRVYDYHLGNLPGYATPFITKDGNDLLLYSGSQRGITYKYQINTDSLRSGSFALLDSDVLGIKPGLRSTISLADINHDGHIDYLAGSIRGGMTLYSSPAWGANYPAGIAAVTKDPDALEVYPVPAHDRLMCRIDQGATGISSAQLYNTLGALVSAPVSTGMENQLNIDVTGVAIGIYILQVVDSHSRVYQKKIAIIK
jgi:hypothetical protein